MLSNKPIFRFEMRQAYTETRLAKPPKVSGSLPKENNDEDIFCAFSLPFPVGQSRALKLSYNFNFLFNTGLPKHDEFTSKMPQSR